MGSNAYDVETRQVGGQDYYQVRDESGRRVAEGPGSAKDGEDAARRDISRRGLTTGKVNKK